MKEKGIQAVQRKILDIMKYIDVLCRDSGITYYIMGGTALGAVRHGGFIPWDDDLDIFMTPSEYVKFKQVFLDKNNQDFVLQEWKTVDGYLEYAKVRMNGTTFIEEQFVNQKDLHQGIYVDIMILHKVPNNVLIQNLIYFCSKFVTLYGLSQRNWKPKTKVQAFVLKMLKILPCQLIAKACYQMIYGYDHRKENYQYCYWITPAKFKQGLFEPAFFSSVVDIPFEDTVLLGSKKIKDYLLYRYGDYMKLPSEEKQQKAVHAFIYDTQRDYKEYLEEYNGEV